MPHDAAVGGSSRFIADSLTPLYYCPIWHELTEEQRLAYNRISGTYWNELIAWFELELAATTLSAVARRHGDEAMALRVDTFLREEELHADVFHRLNELSDPPRYRGKRMDIVRVPRALRPVLRGAAACGLAPALLWVMLLLEERSIEVMSISCASGIDALYARVYRAHAADEARHVAVDLDLIDRAYASMNGVTRVATATLFERLVRNFLLRPGAAARRTVATLLTKRPELRPLSVRLFEEQARAGNDPEYRRMMYSERMTPRTMERLRALPEMARAARLFA